MNILGLGRSGRSGSEEPSGSEELWREDKPRKLKNSNIINLIKIVSLCEIWS